MKVSFKLLFFLNFLFFISTAYSTEIDSLKILYKSTNDISRKASLLKAIAKIHYVESRKDSTIFYLKKNKKITSK